jgi:hypothetical protein
MVAVGLDVNEDILICFTHESHFVEVKVDCLSYRG